MLLKATAVMSFPCLSLSSSVTELVEVTVVMWWFVIVTAVTCCPCLSLNQSVAELVEVTVLRYINDCP